MKKTFYIDEHDVEVGRLQLKNEVVGTSYNTVFQSIVYTILAQREQYAHQVDCFNKMLVCGVIDSPQKCKNHPYELWETLKHMSLNNTKFQYILFAAQSYTKSIHKQIVDNVTSIQDDQRKVRLMLSQTIGGISLKGSSLVLIKCGYRYLVPIDVWVLRLYGKPTDESIWSKSKYVELENEVTKDAIELGLSPAEYQASLWCKYSSFSGAERVDWKKRQKQIFDFKKL